MASTGDTWRLGRRPALDGLRGVAVLLVVASHMGPAGFYFGGGSAGVTLFFTLSGFLITALLLEEHAAHGRIDLRAFYVRRARRLLPALFVFVAAVVAVGASSLRGALPTLLYVGNMPGILGVPVGSLTHTWSLAVEEQFYLLWPLLLIAGLRVLPRGWVLAATTALTAAAALERFVLWDGLQSASRVYAGLDTRADGLLAGCAVALLLHGRPASSSRPMPLTVTAVVGCIGLVGLGGFTPFTFLLLPAVVAVISALTIALLVRGDYAGWLTWRPLTYVGERSYALYLWHVPLTQVIRHEAGWPWWSAFPLLALAWGLTLLSWRYVEEPIKSGRLPGRRRYPDGDVAEPCLPVAGLKSNAAA